MRKNVASQTVSFGMVSATDGSAVTSGTPAVYYTIDGGTQGTGAGSATHEGNGQWSYVPAQAETNGDHVAFTMVISGAINQTVNVWPVSFDPTDSVRLGITALPNAAADGAGGLPISDAGGLDLDTLLGYLTGAVATAANLATVDTVVDAIKAVTDNLPNSGALTSLAQAAVCTEARLSELDAATAGKMANQVDIIQTDTTTDIPAQISGLNNISTADVNAEVVDVLRTDTSTLPGQEAPTATPTLEEAIIYLYKAWRNKSTQTATTYSLYDDAGTTVDQKSTVSDDGTTATRGEVVTGP